MTVHLLGFAKPLNLKGYRASVAPFVKQRKIGSWRRMAVKLEKHLAFTLGNQQLSNFSSAVKSRIGRAQADSAVEEESAPSERPATQRAHLSCLADGGGLRGPRGKACSRPDRDRGRSESGPHGRDAGTWGKPRDVPAATSRWPKRGGSPQGSPSMPRGQRASARVSPHLRLMNVNVLSRTAFQISLNPSSPDFTIMWTGQSTCILRIFSTNPECS